MLMLLVVILFLGAFVLGNGMLDRGSAIRGNEGYEARFAVIAENFLTHHSIMVGSLTTRVCDMACTTLSKSCRHYGMQGDPEALRPVFPYSSPIAFRSDRSGASGLEPLFGGGLVGVGGGVCGPVTVPHDPWPAGYIPIDMDGSGPGAGLSDWYTVVFPAGTDRAAGESGVAGADLVATIAPLSVLNRINNSISGTDNADAASFVLMQLARKIGDQLGAMPLNVGIVRSGMLYNPMGTPSGPGYGTTVPLSLPNSTYYQEGAMVIATYVKQ